MHKYNLEEPKLSLQHLWDMLEDDITKQSTLHLEEDLADVVSVFENAFRVAKRRQIRRKIVGYLKGLILMGTGILIIH